MSDHDLCVVHHRKNQNMNRFESPEHAVRVRTNIVYGDLDDALMPELAEAIAVNRDIREAVIEQQRSQSGAQEGELCPPDSTNPEHHPEILDEIEQLKRELEAYSPDQRPGALGKMAREAREIDTQLNLAEALVFDPYIAKQILDEDEF